MARLAEALLDLAAKSDTADELVDRLIATPKENVTRFKRKLAGLKRSKRFIDWRGCGFGFTNNNKKICKSGQIFSISRFQLPHNYPLTQNRQAYTLKERTDNRLIKH